MKISSILACFAILFIGITINTPSSDDYNFITQERLDSFEEEITIKNNNYESNVIDVNPNIVNSAGKVVEDVIDKGFDIVYGFIKRFIND